ncbi:MAG: NAD-dependent epimerase/dehydratase family protein [Candidatus Sericytochromatia bacterium]
MKPRVVVTGASGFMGAQLLQTLKADYELVALSRSERAPEPGITWKRCDLFSLLQAERALAGADYAIYLVHSMMPKAGLTQGSFADMDLILADNFARAAQKAGIRQIVYLGGIIPQQAELSEHLRSRLEVEQVLGAYGVPVTALRASIIVGPHGSSFQIVERLVERLPVMLSPLWTQTKTQPIAQQDVLEIIRYVLGRPETFSQAFDIGGPDVISYIDLMQATAREVLGRERLIVPVPMPFPQLSYFWVSLITGAPQELIAPLIESLQHPMVATGLPLQQKMGQQPQSLEQAVARAVREERAAQAPTQGQKSAPARARDVRSVQRLPLKSGQDALWLAEKYTFWLPHLLRPFLRVEVARDLTIRFYLLGLYWPLLELDYSEDRSTPDRALYYITGGLLSQESEGLAGRLEFRVIPGGKFALAAIHEYTPRLPWFIYQLSQARLHLWVMHAFIKYLSGLDADKALPATPRETVRA